MNQRLLIFHPTDILRLLCHYSDGAIPLTAEVKQVGISQIFQRLIIFFVESPEWKEGTGVADPMVIEYVGRKTISWDSKGQPVRTIEGVEDPKRQ